MTKIFLDDERFPPEGFDGEIVRNVADFTWVIDQIANGNRALLSYVSFDHDLGGDQTGMQCAKILIEKDLDVWIITGDFTFDVHSMNPVGAENIKSLMSSYLKQMR